LTTIKELFEYLNNPLNIRTDHRTFYKLTLYANLLAAAPISGKHPNIVIITIFLPKSKYIFSCVCNNL